MLTRVYVAALFLNPDRLSNPGLNYPGSELGQLFLTLTENIDSCFPYNISYLYKELYFYQYLKTQIKHIPPDVNLLKKS